jgi:hypothetical protein
MHLHHLSIPGKFNRYDSHKTTQKLKRNIRRARNEPEAKESHVQHPFICLKKGDCTIITYQHGNLVSFILSWRSTCKLKTKRIPNNLILDAVPLKDVVTLLHLKPAQVLIPILKSSCDKLNNETIYLKLPVPRNVSKHHQSYA